MINKLRENIVRYQMIHPGDAVLVALSGGGDSVGLFYGLLELQSVFSFTICCAHVNHGIRSIEADRDEAFCRDLCAQNNVALYCEKHDIPAIARREKCSLELAGRNQRYDFFNRLCASQNLQKIATAHHVDDNAESMLLHLSRGSALEGLCGIRPVRGNIIRPMIDITRAEVESYLSARNATFMTDATNADDTYARNMLRLHVMPVLHRINPSFSSTVFSMGKVLTEEEDFLNSATKSAYEQIVTKSSDLVSIDRAPYLALHTAIRRRVLVAAYQNLTGTKLPSRQTFALDELAQKNAVGSKQLDLGGACAKIGYTTLIITKDRLAKPVIPFSFTLNIGGTNEELLDAGYHIASEITTLEEKNTIINSKIHKKFEVFLFNYDKIYDTVVCRNRMQGDQYRPLGAAGRRTIKKMMIDAKIPAERRDMLPVFTCGADILRAYGLRINEAYKVDTLTKRVLKIIVTEENDHA